MRGREGRRIFELSLSEGNGEELFFLQRKELVQKVPDPQEVGVLGAERRLLWLVVGVVGGRA